jgi:hypothetical protein
MPVIPVNPNHPAASAARKRTPSVAVSESPTRAAKIRANNALMQHGASAAAPLIATDADNGIRLAHAHAVSVAAFAAAGSVAASARFYDSSNSSESDLDIIGGGLQCFWAKVHWYAQII